MQQKKNDATNLVQKRQPLQEEPSSSLTYAMRENILWQTPHTNSYIMKLQFPLSTTFETKIH
uniref:Bm565 n=1 Tax=Brugia malayi TaxID=6279 RepID=A0A1I9G3F4_BRUMA|nr:Bm565 [Brugia malayi]